MKQLVVTRAGVVAVNLLYILIVALNNVRARRGEDVKAYLAMTSEGEFQSFSETGGCFCSLDGDALMVRIKGENGHGLHYLKTTYASRLCNKKRRALKVSNFYYLWFEVALNNFKKWHLLRNFVRFKSMKMAVI